MLDSFQLAVIVEGRRERSLLRVPIHAALQQELAMQWGEQLNEFLDNIQKVPFNLGYHPENHERFSLSPFCLPPWLAETTCTNVDELDSIVGDEDLLDRIRGVIGFSHAADGAELLLFQNFSRGHVIQPGRFLFLQNGIYTTTPSRALTLASQLSAVYYIAERELLFKNFHNVNTFLLLANCIQEATDAEIREVLTQSIFVAEDVNVTVTTANQWVKKRFAMLKESSILDRHSAADIQRRGAQYGVRVQLDNDKIVFPADKVASKKLLQFLNEEIFRGAITETIYETNSKREAD